jgi:hypothetical protein
MQIYRFFPAKTAKYANLRVFAPINKKCPLSEKNGLP